MAEKGKKSAAKKSTAATKKANSNIYTKMIAIRKDIEALEAKGENEHFNYKFVKDSQIVAKLKELYDKHNVLFFPGNIETVNASYVDTKRGKQVSIRVRVDYIFIDGDNTESRLEGSCQGMAMDSGDKGLQKAVTSALKYMHLKTFLIPTKDQELDDESPEITSGEIPANGAAHPAMQEAAPGDDETPADTDPLAGAFPQ